MLLDPLGTKSSALNPERFEECSHRVAEDGWCHQVRRGLHQSASKVLRFSIVHTGLPFGCRFSLIITLHFLLFRNKKLFLGLFQVSLYVTNLTFKSDFINHTKLNILFEILLLRKKFQKITCSIVFGSFSISEAL